MGGQNRPFCKRNRFHQPLGKTCLEGRFPCCSPLFFRMPPHLFYVYFCTLASYLQVFFGHLSTQNSAFCIFFVSTQKARPARSCFLLRAAAPFLSFTLLYYASKILHANGASVISPYVTSFALWLMYIVTFCFSFPLVTISRPSSDGTIWKCQSRITRSIRSFVIFSSRPQLT